MLRLVGLGQCGLLGVSRYRRANIKLVAAGLVGLASMLTSTAAMAACSVTYSFSNGTTADATQVNQNFTDVANCASIWNLSGGVITPASTSYTLNLGSSSPPTNAKFTVAGPAFSSIYGGNTIFGISMGGSGSDAGALGVNVAYGTGTTRTYIGSYAASWFEWSDNGSAIAFLNAAAGTAGNAITGTNRFQITSAGNVGIGSATPSEKLYVSGNIYATGNITCGGSCGGGGSSYWSLSGTNLIPTSTTYKVGLGSVTSPSTTLDVGGTLNASGAVTLGSSLNVTGAVTCGSGCASGPWSVSGSNIIPSSTSPALTPTLLPGRLAPMRSRRYPARSMAWQIRSTPTTPMVI